MASETPQGKKRYLLCHDTHGRFGNFQLVVVGIYKSKRKAQKVLEERNLDQIVCVNGNQAISSGDLINKNGEKKPEEE